MGNLLDSTFAAFSAGGGDPLIFGAVLKLLSLAVASNAPSVRSGGG